jgi:hypothetical protein
MVFHLITVVFPEMEKSSDRNHQGTPRMIEGSLGPIIQENVHPTAEELPVTVIIPRLAVTTKVFNDQAGRR